MDQIKGERADKDTDSPLFFHVSYFLHPRLGNIEKHRLAQLLDANGAKPAPLQVDNLPDLALTTHIVANDMDFPMAEKAKAVNVSIVTPLWVENAVKHKSLPKPECYSPEQEKIFSGIVVTTSGIPQGDVEKIFGVLAPDGEKYDRAKAHSDSLIKIILPHWFNDCFRLHRLLPDTPYLFPDPPVLQVGFGLDQQNTSGSNQKSTSAAGQKSSVLTPLANQNIQLPVPKENFLKDVRFLLSSSLRISADMRRSFETALEKAGAIIVPAEAGYERDSVDCLVCKYRSGSEYVQASRDGKLVGSLHWVVHILTREKLVSPKLQLLNYPIPTDPCPEFSNYIITVSNYFGPAREYLKKMIAMIGATYTPHMTIKNTHLVCASQNGEKFKKAQDWNVNVVNHLWLEESFQQWACQSISKERYTTFPLGNGLCDIVGTTNIPSEIAAQWFANLPGTVAYSKNNLENTTANAIRTDERYHTPTKKKAVFGTIEKIPHTMDVKTPAELTWMAPIHPNSEGAIVTIDYRRRQAASAAIEALHNTVMPDMNAFESEMRAQKRKSPSISRRTPNREQTPDNNIMSSRGKNKGISPFGALPPNSGISEQEGNGLEKSVQTKRKRRAVEQSWDESPSKDLSKKTKITAERESTPTRTSRSIRVATGDASSQGISPSRTNRQYVKVLWTGCKPTNAQINGLKALGAKMAKVPHECTHLIAHHVARTEKFLCAMSVAHFILSDDWVKDSISHGRLVDEESYLLKDKAAERNYKFSLRASLAKARTHKLLAGLEIYMTPSAEPKPELMKSVIECAGGKLLTRLPPRRQWSPDNLIIISCEEDRGRWRDFTGHNPPLPIYSSEIILTGVLRQSIEEREEFLLK
ncbi:uncharacterized protein VTP21DRAFT_858 [Calcarisporiella thermophila]|uniref:uncharacterized protein n=1 Tax=Calcarisporiella thermophila TaxID=911321 RepID=UPI003742F9A6